MWGISDLKHKALQHELNEIISTETISSMCLRQSPGLRTKSGLSCLCSLIFRKFPALLPAVLRELPVQFPLMTQMIHVTAELRFVVMNHRETTGSDQFQLEFLVVSEHEKNFPKTLPLTVLPPLQSECWFVTMKNQRIRQHNEAFLIIAIHVNYLWN